MRTIGTASYGLRAPIVKQGDDLIQIIVDTVLNSGLEIKDRDVLGITESIVARCQGNYVTIDEVAEEIRSISDNAESIHVFRPIYSRNRFAMILKAIARAAGKYVVIHVTEKDEVGNVLRNHPFTGLNYDEYYKSIVEAEGKECTIAYDEDITIETGSSYLIDARMYFTTSNEEEIKELKNNNGGYCTLAYICRNKCEYGLYGSNKASEELLKLFPSGEYSRNLVREVQQRIKDATGKLIEVMVYGDGCFKDPVGGIWEFADPVVSPASTMGLQGTPNEIKIKNFADEKYKDLKGEELNTAIKEEIKNKSSNLKGSMTSQGTTPRRYTDLLGSLMDLTSGSGDKGTPFIYIQGYFDNMSND
jgi:hypothetical protein